ncbi:MAG: uracil-DNA glycosylase [Balneolaceae bacterium]|nr:uracil-DNA glycosylase [Balneolaceae bacterium]
MSDSHRTLYDEIKDFLEAERQVYGEFSVPELKEIHDEEATVVTPDVAEEENVRYEVSSLEPEVEKTTEEKIGSCNTLEELRELCGQAEELKTDLENTNLVFGVGNPKADLMLIGEAPGEQEDIRGEPFVGAAGRLLNKILAAIRFERSDIYIANILKHRPPGNRNPNPEECKNSLPYLYRQIELIDPKIILCLGKISGNTMLGGENTLKSMRSKKHNFRGIELYVTYHPAALLRNPQWKRPTWEDVQLVRKRYDELGGKP